MDGLRAKDDGWREASSEVWGARERLMSMVDE